MTFLRSKSEKAMKFDVKEMNSEIIGGAKKTSPEKVYINLKLMKERVNIHGSSMRKRQIK